MNSDDLVVVWKNHGIFRVKVQNLRSLKLSARSQNIGVVNKGTQHRQWRLCGYFLQLFQFTAAKEKGPNQISQRVRTIANFSA